MGVEPQEVLDETARLRIERLGSGGTVLSTLITDEHTVHVAPGSYGIQLIEGGLQDSTQAIVGAGSTVEVEPLYIDTK